VTKNIIFFIFGIWSSLLRSFNDKNSANKKNMVEAKIFVENNLNIFRQDSILISDAARTSLM
jgi:hypothetical protein